MAFDAGSIEATLDLDRTPFNRGLDEAKADGDKFARKSYTATAKINVDDKEAQQSLNRIASATETTAARSGNTIGRALLNPMVIQFGLLPGLAAIAATGAGVAIGAIPLALAAAAAVLNKDNQLLISSWTTTWNTIKAQTADAASTISLDLSEIPYTIDAGFSRIEPLLTTLFENAGPEIKTFAEGVVDLGRNAFPGFYDAVAAGQPVMNGWKTLLAQTGLGVTEFFDALANRSNDIGTGLGYVGTLIRGLVGFVGELSGEFSGAWASSGREVTQVLGQVEDIILKIAAGGLPALSNSLNAFLTVIGGVLSVAAPFAQEIGGIGGYALAGVVGVKLLTSAFNGLKGAYELIAGIDIAGTLAKAEKPIFNFAASTGNVVAGLSGSERAGDAFFNTLNKLGPLVAGSAGLFGALAGGIAAVVIPTYLAAEHFADLQKQGADLGQSMALGGNAAKDAGAKLLDLESNADKLRKQISNLSQTQDHSHDILLQSQGGYSVASLSAGEYQSQLQDLNVELSAAEKAQADYEKQLGPVGLAQARASQALKDYNDAVTTYGANSPQAVAAQQAYATAVDGVDRAQRGAALATQDANQKMLDQQNIQLAAVGAGLSYQASVLNTQQAQKSLAESIAKTGTNSEQTKQATLAYQQALLQQIEAAGSAAKATHASGTASEQAAAQQQAQTQEILKLAAAAGSNAPPALLQLVAGLDATQIAAYQSTGKVDGLHQAVVTLPDGRTIKINVDDQGTPVINSVIRSLDSVPRVVNVALHVSTNANQSIQSALAYVPHASGGAANPGDLSLVGEQGPELRFEDRSGFYATYRQSQDILQAWNLQNRTSPSLGKTSPPVQNGTDQNTLSEALYAAVMRALNGAKLEIDGAGVARLVNKTNATNSTR